MTPNTHSAQDIQDAAVKQGVLLTWTVFQAPLDYPDDFVLRPFSSKSGEAMPFVWTAKTLSAVQTALPAGLYRMPPDPSDPPTIVEIWI